MTWRRALSGGLLLVGLGAVGACGSLQSPGQESQQATLAGVETEPSRTAGATEEPQITPDPTGGPTPVAGRPWSASASAVCTDSVGAGFQQVAQSADEGGVTTFWVRGGDWRVCDLAVAPGAEPVVFGPARGRGLAVPQLAVSTSPADGADEAATTRVVGGGLLPWPVEEIRYALPDGEDASARFVASEGAPGQTWWVMAHDAPTSALEDRAQVTVSVVGGAAEAFRVPWERILRGE